MIPIWEYACPVWHTNLPQYLSNNIYIKEGIKMYFHGLGYAEIRRRVNLDALNISRDNIR